MQPPLREETVMKAPIDQGVVDDVGHEHPAQVHTHDHYHVVHHHTKNPLSQFEHRGSYHIHEHDHAPLHHAHRDRSEEDERDDHDSTAHIHDHLTPVEGAR